MTILPFFSPREDTKEGFASSEFYATFYLNHAKANTAAAAAALFCLKEKMQMPAQLPLYVATAYTDVN